MIEIKELTKRYGKKQVIKDISLVLKPCTYGLVGPNGAGKTTLLRVIAGVLKATSGEIVIDYDKDGIGYLPQKFGCFPEVTVYEQMKYFACLKGIHKTQYAEEIVRVLKTVNLYDKQDVKCKKLSGGMIRRLGIAQALLGNPTLLLLDEPTVGLDPEERNHFNNIIRNLEGKVTILLSTHLIEDIKYLCNEVIIIKSGQILKVAHSNEIASLASGRVYKIPERELSNLKSPFYIENYLIRDNEKNEKIVKVLLLGDISNMEKYSACEVDIEDGYLLILKEKELHAE